MSSIDKTGQPKVSVCVISFNHEKYISECLQSIIEQDVDFCFEIIVGDDASTDSTAAIIAEFQHRYPDLIFPIFRSKNVGVISNVLEVIDNCRGSYIAFCEGDDCWLSKDKLAKQSKVLDDNPLYGGCSSYTDVIDENGHLKKNRKKSLMSFLHTKTDLIHNYKLETRTCSLLLRRTFILPVWPVSFLKVTAFDYYLKLLATFFGPIYVIPEYLAAYRVHSQGTWSAIRETQRVRKKIVDLEVLKDFLRDDKYAKKLLKVRIGCLQIRAALLERPRKWQEFFSGFSKILQHPIIFVVYQRYSKYRTRKNYA